MNRKQRRALRHRSGHAPGQTASARTLAELLDRAIARHRAGAHAEAENFCRQILALSPDHAKALQILGEALMPQGKVGDALAALEYAAALQPDVGTTHQELARACLAAGRLKTAIAAAARALELEETTQSKTLFAQCVRDARFTADVDRIRPLLRRALSETWDRPRDIAGACISLIKLDRLVSDGIARATTVWPMRLAAEELPDALIAALSRDTLLVSLLELAPIADLALEQLLTNVRFALLTAGSIAEKDGDEHLAFACALARQCFINQHVFSTTDAEIDQAQRLQKSLEAVLARGDECPPLWPAIVGAYFPLHTLSKAEALFDRSWPAGVQALIRQQVREPLEERGIAERVPVLTTIDDDVSVAVRRQYEESPYPRWVKAGPPGEPIVIDGYPSDCRLDVLVAGCGTGLSTIEFARQTPRARILALDLSRASLAYAQRMAESFGLTNIEFAQADILQLAAISREFDYIDASGILHHLADPWHGWRVLLAQLRPGGAMQVGLYSALARRSVVAARALITERGYRPCLADIRRCREEIIAADPKSPLRSIVQWNDFFASNECRDLLFHVQEHQTTLPEIKVFLSANNLRFAGFILDTGTLQRFTASFPGQAAMIDLESWHAFETQAPETFAGMYQFWVRKPGAAAPH